MAFQTWYKHFKYQVMPFELFNIPARFQSYINKILAKKLDIFIIIYLNDIFIYNIYLGKNYIRTVKCVLDVLQKYRFFANLKKC